MEHYTIEQIRSDLERIRGEEFTDEQFDVLIAGFRLYAARKGLYNSQTIHNAINKGWMSAQMAHFFKRYALE